MSQAMDDLRGSLVALVTPMTASGAIDWAALDGLVDWHLESGTHGIVPVGTTGESATLSHAEQKQVIEAVVRRVNGRVPVVAGTGANATAEAIELTQAAQGDGADYCLSVTPYYNKPTQEVFTGTIAPLPRPWTCRWCSTMCRRARRATCRLRP